MPKKRRQGKIPTPAWERPRGALGRRILGRGPRFYATAGVVALVLVAIGLVGYAYWADYRAAQGRPDSTAVQVGDTKYTLRYFAQRLQMFVQQVGGPGSQIGQPSVAIPAVAAQLVQENIVRRFAQEQGVAASEDDIRNAIVARLGLTADDPNYDARFQEELVRSGLTEDEYKQMAEAAVLNDKLRQKLEEGLPASVESIHLRQIELSDEAAADDVVQQLQAGADFAALAAEKSLDTTSKDKGGDLGWIPRGYLDKSLEDTVFALEPGKAQSVPTQAGAAVFQVVEKAQDQPIDADKKIRLATTALQKWVDEKKAQLDVKEFVSQDEDKARWAIERAYSVT